MDENQREMMRLMRELSKALLQAARVEENKYEKGVFLVKSYFGYDVKVDGTCLGMDIAWGVANGIAQLIGQNRPQTDERGYSRDRKNEP